ncbi:hypothetical protein GDO86_015653 [Hymenochirus boettgeri]|uniref:UPAR/Ly6 domain-containing protein n=1 Tax=Hymenochirus boettgeri TaxID=247094 RepID=A0A8T2JTU2_9PIPI|nr:hypothetical protein GDO86_015653 [Hymenochirus boettgeri]
MNNSAIILSLLFLMHCGESLRCYTCLFPTIAPLGCIKFPVSCPPYERCLITSATGRKGDFQFVLHDRSCSISSFCDTTGHRSILGINVTFHNTCCDTDLCNGGTTEKATLATTLLPPILLHLFHS